MQGEQLNLPMNKVDELEDIFNSIFMSDLQLDVNPLLPQNTYYVDHSMFHQGLALSTSELSTASYLNIPFLEEEGDNYYLQHSTTSNYSESSPSLGDASPSMSTAEYNFDKGSLSPSCSNASIKQKKKPYCNLCYRGFGRTQDYHRHMATIHSRKKKFVCEVCQKKFSRRDSLQRHQKSEARKTRT